MWTAEICTVLLESVLEKAPASRSHVTTPATVTGQTVRRLVGKLKSRVQDPAFSQAELLKVLLASVSIKLAGDSDTEQVAEKWKGSRTTARVEITRPFRSLEDDNDKDVKRQPLGGPAATILEEVLVVKTSDIMTDDTAPLVHEEARSVIELENL